MNPNYKLLAPVGRCNAYENSKALPRAYSVQRAIGAKSPEDAKMKFSTDGFDPGVHVILRQDDLKEQDSFAPGNVSISSYSENEVVIDTVFTGDGFLILADQYYPGWKAYVDGTETKVLRANEILRGVTVPAGKHTVTFRYEPAYLIPAMILSLIAFTGFLIIGLLGLRKEDEALPETESPSQVENVNIAS